MTTSLIEYAASGGGRNPGPTCWLCGIPERAEVEAAMVSGVQFSVIVRWLKGERGHEQATLAKVKNHLANHVSR
jgi:hypothetical protein